ncbi:matrixin family metalloprotease [Asticcacaulis sp.]|uniref:matrixin family metalloprotease n=1 Tax=Asticcacaulis sp. TaxID=1872648 RepID=UPI00262A1D5B|nr:matrixin family metalloprotease [Asticcacaulis sp.]
MDMSLPEAVESHSATCPCCAGRAHSDDAPQAATALTTTVPGVSAYDLSTVDIRALLYYRSTSDAAGNFTLGNARWNIDQAAGKGLTILEMLNSDIGVGTGVDLKYSFAQTTSGSVTGFRPMNTIEKQIVVEQLAKWAAVANVTFTETTENTGKTLMFSTDTFTAADRPVLPAVGFGYLPSGVSYVTSSDSKVTSLSFSPLAGDVRIDNWFMDRMHADGSLNAGEYSAIAAVAAHEIGHALGLSHGFDGQLNLPANYQIKLLTIMAYDDVGSLTYGFTASGGALNVDNSQLKILDILAIQHLYGANTKTNAGNNTYTWAQDTAFRTAIYDAGGTDTIDLSASTMRSAIDLTPNSLSSINLRVTNAEKLVNTASLYHSAQNAAMLYTGENNLGIVGTIENVRAGSGNDRINGNAVANEIWGGAGNDSVWGGAGDDRLFLGAGNDRVVAGSGNNTIDGGTGIDVAGLAGSASQARIARAADGTLTVTRADGVDTHAGTEFVLFRDGLKLYWNVGAKLAGGFDESFYLAKNPDVAAAVAAKALASGFDHYIKFGQAEGRFAVDARSDLYFDESFYLAANPDVASAVAAGSYWTGWVHYQAFGKVEGRTATPLFDKAYYLSKNADVKAAGVDPWQHFMTNGWREGRDPSAFLDVSAYLDTNVDIKAAGVNPVTHYLLYGQAEGRLLVATADIGIDWTYVG